MPTSYPYCESHSDFTRLPQYLFRFPSKPREEWSPNDVVHNEIAQAIWSSIRAPEWARRHYESLIAAFQNPDQYTEVDLSEMPHDTRAAMQSPIYRIFQAGVDLGFVKEVSEQNRSIYSIPVLTEEDMSVWSVDLVVEGAGVDEIIPKVTIIGIIRYQRGYTEENIGEKLTLLP